MLTLKCQHCTTEYPTKSELDIHTFIMHGDLDALCSSIDFSSSLSTSTTTTFTEYKDISDDDTLKTNMKRRRFNEEDTTGSSRKVTCSSTVTTSVTFSLMNSLSIPHVVTTEFTTTTKTHSEQLRLANNEIRKLTSMLKDKEAALQSVRPLINLACRLQDSIDSFHKLLAETLRQNQRLNDKLIDLLTVASTRSMTGSTLV